MRGRVSDQPIRKSELGHEAGFTLIEMLCVLVIIGLMTGVAALSLRAPDRAEETLSQNLLIRFNTASKDAIFSGHSRALSVTETGLQLMTYRDNEWVIEFDQPLDQLTARLSVNDETVKIPEEPTPFVIFDPTGEVDEFILAIRGYDEPLIFSSREDGSIGLGLDN